jgi:Bax protein
MVFMGRRADLKKTQKVFINLKYLCGMHTERIWAYSILIAVFLLAFINYLYFGERTPTAVPIEQLVTLEYRNPQSFDEIEPIDSLVKPILYSDVLFIEDLTIQEAKQAFINIMVPAILVAKEEIAYQREQVLYLVEKDILNDLDSAFLLPLFETYKTDDPNELIKRMRVHPTSIVLGQAAIESGWGKSRFFKEGQ